MSTNLPLLYRTFGLAGRGGGLLERFPYVVVVLQVLLIVPLGPGHVALAPVNRAVPVAAVAGAFGCGVWPVFEVTSGIPVHLKGSPSSRFLNMGALVSL